MRSFYLFFMDFKLNLLLIKRNMFMIQKETKLLKLYRIGQVSFKRDKIEINGYAEKKIKTENIKHELLLSKGLASKHFSLFFKDINSINNLFLIYQYLISYSIKFYSFSK